MAKQLAKKTKITATLSVEERVKLLGDRIREVRKQKGYSNAMKFAFDKDISPGMMATWEKGSNISFESLCKLADAFGISVSELINGI